MSAHPQLSEANAAEIVSYILSLTGEKRAEKSVAKLPLTGIYTPEAPTGENGNGGYILQAAYRDRGTKGLLGIESEKIIVLRHSSIRATADQIDGFKDVSFTTVQTPKAAINVNGAYFFLKNVDMAGIKTIDFSVLVELVNAGVTLELHLGAPDGKLLGKPVFVAGGKVARVTTVKVVPMLVAGLHTVYVVAKNAVAALKQPLFQLSRIQFSH